MHVLVEIVVKSLLIAGLTLGLLQVLRKRSAAERSWVAHVGLLALVIDRSPGCEVGELTMCLTDGRDLLVHADRRGVPRWLMWGCSHW